VDSRLLRNDRVVAVCFIFNGPAVQSVLMVKAVQSGLKVMHSSEMSGTTHPKIQRNLPEELINAVIQILPS